jgi:hypothetical protein
MPKMKKPDTRFEQAIKERKDWLEINSDADATEHDAIDSLIDDCGKMPDGSCSMAGSEDCDFECPFS